MKKLPRSARRHAVAQMLPEEKLKNVGLVLSGGGVRAAYQAGFLKAIAEKINTNPFSVITASSVGSINGFVLAVGLSNMSFSRAVDNLVSLWAERTFNNTFDHVGTVSFLRSLFYAVIIGSRKKIIAPKASILNPLPLMRLLEKFYQESGGIKLSFNGLQAFGVMTTKMDRNIQKGVLFVQGLAKNLQNLRSQNLYDVVVRDQITVRHCFASAALPTIMPPVQLDTGDHSATFVDGGFVQNVPIDPAVRLGAEKILVIDVSGRTFWKKALNVPLDSKPPWELRNQEDDNCAVPKQILKEEVDFSLGRILKDIVGKRPLSALGPIYPLFNLFKRNLGEDLAYEAATYVVLNPDFIREVAKRGYESGAVKAVEMKKRFISLSLSMR